MYLVDTNVWLERLLEQGRAEEVAQFLDRTPSERLVITDFAFHSIGVILTKLHKAEALLRFVQDIFIDGSVTLIHLGPEDTQRMLDVIERVKLDFEKALPSLDAITTTQDTSFPSRLSLSF